MAKNKLTPADEKFIIEFLNGAELKKTFKSGQTVTRRNRFSGDAADLDPRSAAAFDFVLQVEPVLQNAAALKRIHPKLTIRNVVSKFDRARFIVMKLDQESYMTLLD